MYLLAIDSTGKYASVSLMDLDSGKILLEKKSGDERSHLKSLIPMVDDLLKETGVSKKEIEYIAPSIGPGSFTGIRIGVATARALAQGLNVKLIPVPTLDSFLYKSEANACENISVIIYARRMQVYGFTYSKGEFILPPGPYMLNDILDSIKDLPKVHFFGDGIDYYMDNLNDDRFSFSIDRYQDSISCLRYAYNNMDKAITYNYVTPMYMRVAEAEEKLKRGELKISHMRQD